MVPAKGGGRFVLSQEQTGGIFRAVFTEVLRQDEAPMTAVERRGTWLGLSGDDLQSFSLGFKPPDAKIKQSNHEYAYYSFLQVFVTQTLL